MGSTAPALWEPGFTALDSRTAPSDSLKRMWRGLGDLHPYLATAHRSSEPHIINHNNMCKIF